MFLKQSARFEVKALAAWTAVVCLVGVTTAAEAIQMDRLPSQHGLDRWDRDRGLPQTSVEAIVQTPDGKLWVGTQGGLVRCNGASIENLEDVLPRALLCARITALLSQPDGTLWIGTAGSGLWAVHAGAFSRHAAVPGEAMIVGLASGPNGHVVVATRSHGVLDLSDSGAISWLLDGSPPEMVTAVASMPDGRLYVGTIGGLLEAVAGVLKRVTAVPQALSGVTALAAQGSALLVGTNNGLHRWHDGVWRRWGRQEGLAEDTIQRLLVDRHGFIWIGNRTVGLACLLGDRVVMWEREGFGQVSVNSLLEDQEGSLWIGSGGLGLLRMREGLFQVLGKGEGLADEEIWSIYEDPLERVWIGTYGGGVTVLDRGAQRTYSVADGLPSQIVNTVLQCRSGDVWIGTNEGVGVLRDGRISRPDGDPSFRLRTLALTEDESGAIWIGTVNGLTHWNPKDPKPRPWWDSRIGWTRVNALLADQGGLWVATRGRGLLHLVGNDVLPVEHNERLANDDVFSLQRDRQGRLWFATASLGVGVIAEGRLSLIGTSEGLPDVGPVTTVLPDLEGGLWMPTLRGVLMMRSEDLLARRVAGQPVRYRLLGVADGLRSQECNGGFGSVGAVTRNGVVWIATMSGAASIDPRMVGEAAVVRTRIEAVLADGTTYPVATPVVIPPGLRRLEVHYLARTLLAPQRFVYRFMLKGYDQDFVEVQGTRTAVYTKLPPGRYQFKVQARLPGAPWGEMADPLSIVVRPRFYQTSWFLLVAVVSLGLLAGHTHVTRIRNVRARLFAVMEERQRIAREIHDTLSQGLTGISIHLESLGDSIREDPDAAETHLAWARQLVRESLAQARSTVWNLRSDDCSMRDLAGVLRRIGDGLTAGTGRTFEIKVSGTQPETPPQVEETLVRIGQEALTNATRHAAASSIEVELSFDRADIVLVVRDDGRGFDPDLTDSGTHFGIKGMRERAATVGGHVDISSTPGKGTVVSVTVPSRGRSSR